MSHATPDPLPYPTPRPSDASTGFLLRLRGILRGERGAVRGRRRSGAVHIENRFHFQFVDNLWISSLVDNFMDILWITKSQEEHENKFCQALFWLLTIFCPRS